MAIPAHPSLLAQERRLKVISRLTRLVDALLLTAFASVSFLWIVRVVLHWSLNTAWVVGIGLMGYSTTALAVGCVRGNIVDSFKPTTIVSQWYEPEYSCDDPRFYRGSARMLLFVGSLLILLAGCTVVSLDGEYKQSTDTQIIGWERQILVNGTVVRSAPTWFWPFSHLMQVNAAYAVRNVPVQGTTKDGQAVSALATAHFAIPSGVRTARALEMAKPGDAADDRVGQELAQALKKAFAEVIGRHRTAELNDHVFLLRTEIGLDVRLPYGFRWTSDRTIELSQLNPTFASE